MFNKKGDRPMTKFLFTIQKTVLISSVFLCSQAFGYSGGKMTCFFELFSKKNWPKVEKTTTFEVNIAQGYEDSIESRFLENKIRLRYVPGIVAAGDVRYVSITMTYAGADSGADAPLVENGQYMFNIGRQDSDLVGAFLNCKVQSLK